ncbi:MAG: dihydrodipicolinate synthase family protein, partial [Bdellovibrionales bacterium]|nr:dihydrodipicolinate synthase family protein [Bdellovibrionales bacterium]
MSHQFEGIFTAIITPFKNGDIDWSSLKKLVRQQLDGGIQGIVVCGTTGESPTLNSEEKKQLFAFIQSEVAGAVPLIMGTGGNDTAATVEATRAAAGWGAAAALVVVPYYNKPTQRGLLAHYKKIATEGGLPVVLYNVPGRTI